MFASMPIPYIFIIVVALTLALNALRIMRLISMLTAGRSRTPTAASMPDSHLSFDERIAERMRELGKQQESVRSGPFVPQAPWTPGFGRRGE